MSMRKFSDHSLLVIIIWGQAPAPGKAIHYFDVSLLEEEESRAVMLWAWEGKLPFPNNEFDWPTWLEVATERVMRCNTSLAKAKKHLGETHVKAHAKKV